MYVIYLCFAGMSLYELFFLLNHITVETRFRMLPSMIRNYVSRTRVYPVNATGIASSSVLHTSLRLMMHRHPYMV